MTTKAGIWIDHRKAVIVTLSPEGDQTTLIASHVEKHLQRDGDSPLQGPYEARQVPADDSRQRTAIIRLWSTASSDKANIIAFYDSSGDSPLLPMHGGVNSTVQDAADLASALAYVAAACALACR